MLVSLNHCAQLYHSFDTKSPVWHKNTTFNKNLPKVAQHASVAITIIKYPLSSEN